MNDSKLERNVFLTGADGMLGASICRELIKQGYEVKAMVLPERNTNVLKGLNIQLAKGNLLNKDFLEREMATCAFVIHAAALTNVWPRRSEKVRTVNIEGTRNIMEVAEKLKMKRMVHIGTACSFSFGPKDKPGDETNLFDGWKYGMDYIDSKYLAQQQLLNRHSQTGFPVVIVNPTYMIGPFDSGPSSGKMLVELYNNRLPGYSPGGKNFVYSADVAVAAVNALKFGRDGECYIAGNENLTYKEFFIKACAVGDKKFTLFRVPGFLVIGLGLINSIIARIINKPPDLSYSMARVACIRQIYSSKKAQLELKMPQTPIEEGIVQCLSWFKENGYIKG